MKKEVFHLPDQGDSIRVEKTEPLIIWTLQIGIDVLAMPELYFLINQYYFIN